jgi:hypothetical protein
MPAASRYGLAQALGLLDVQGLRRLDTPPLVPRGGYSTSKGYGGYSTSDVAHMHSQEVE